MNPRIIYINKKIIDVRMKNRLNEHILNIIKNKGRIKIKKDIIIKNKNQIEFYSQYAGFVLQCGASELS